MRLINSFLIGLLIPSLALANYPPTTIKGQTDASAKTKFGFQVPFQQATDLGGTASLIETGNSNILPNPGFEASVSGWTASGGATATANTTAKGTGLKGYDWDSNAAAQTLVSQTITIPEGFKGKNGTVSCNIKTVSGTSTHTITADDGTNNIVSPQTIASSTSVFTDNKVNFIFPSSGSVRVKITSVASNEPEVYVDDCRLGLADNIGTVQQAQFVGSISYPVTANCIWSSLNTIFSDFAADTDCGTPTITGDVSAPATKVPNIIVKNIKPGTYQFKVTGSLFSDSVSQNVSFRLYDGTNGFGDNGTENGSSGNTAISQLKVDGSISYTSPQTNVTFSLQGKRPTSGALYADVRYTPFKIEVFYFPSASQQAVSSANSDYSGASLTLTSSNTQGFGTPTGSCTHDRVGGNLLMNCKYTSGTVAASEARVNLPSGLTSADTTRIPSIQVAGNAVVSNTGANILYVLIEPSTGYVTFGRQNATDSGLTKLNGNVVMGSAATMSFQVSIPIQGWSSNQRAPTLVGSVTSNASGAERIERAIISGGAIGASCTTSPCTIFSQSGSWLTSVTRSAVGTYSSSFPSSTFSAPPTCFCVNNGTSTRNCSISALTVTGFNISTWANANTLEDTAFSLICMGAR